MQVTFNAVTSAKGHLKAFQVVCIATGSVVCWLQECVCVGGGGGGGGGYRPMLLVFNSQPHQPFH